MLGARIAVAVSTAVAAVMLSTGTASGATVTKTLNFPLSGNSTTNIFKEPFSCCHIVVGSPLNIDTDIHGGIALDMKSTANAGTHNDLTFTDTNLRQGSTLDLTNTFTRDSQSLGVDYTLSGELNVFGFDLTYNHTEGDTIANCGLPLLSDSCSDTKSITLFSFTPIDIGVAYLQVSFNADITTSANLTGDGVTSHRTLTAGGSDVLTPTDLTFTSTPQARDESAPLPCTVPAGQPVNYAMGDESSHVDGSVTEGFGASVQGDAFLRVPPFPDVHLFTVGPFNLPNLFSLPPVTFNTISLSAPAQNVDLGTLLPNLTPPTVATDIPTNGTEGNAVQLGVTGTGPGGSLSNCGTAGLTFAWSFDDGGTATGQNPQHTFAEEGTHTGTVVVTDPTGLSTTLTFSVPVADAPLTLSCATPPVTLQAFNGTVADLHDGNPSAPLSDFTATIDWGDSSTSSGAVGGSSGDYTVTGAHTYASTGYYDVSVHVDDVGGSSADATKCTMLVFAFAPGSGSFVVGDGSSGIGNTVTFWGAQWASLNVLTGGTAPAAFKGFAKSPAQPTCGPTATWSTDPGNSAPPPAGPLPAFMGVISTDSAVKNGAQISGTTPHIVVVQTNPGYAPNPGHAGTGTVVAQVC